jgi:site-specific DNA-methyltransferase (adenine-specific)
MINSYFKSNNNDFTLIQGDCIEVMKSFDFKFDMVFADPPYFLSNNGITIQNGKVASVNKGLWDKSNGKEKDKEFNYAWLSTVKDKLKDDGTIWISGTFHNIFSIADILTDLDFKILNVITWVKTNPPPNLTCRYFTHSTEFIIWASKNKNSKHCFNYELMKNINGGKQMKDVWLLPAIAPWEKSCGKHPTQKPLRLLSRIILSSTKENDWILDPFSGSSTTGIAANLLNRKFLGIEKEKEFLEISKNRRLELDNKTIFENYKNKL